MRLISHLSKALFIAVSFMLLASNVHGQFDGYTIYFESDRDGEIAIYRLDSPEPVMLSSFECQHPSVTADNSTLYFTRLTETAWGRFWNIFYLFEGEEHKLTRNEIYDEWDPVISRDDTIAAFSSMRNGNLEIITYPVDENDLAFRVTDSPKPDEEPALAVGEQWVYWVGRTGNNSYILRAPARGGAVERMSEEGVTWDEHPSISADGRWMVYSSIEKTDNFVTSQGRTLLAGHKYPGMGGSTTPAEDYERAEVEDEEEEGSSAHSDEIYERWGNSDIWLMDLTTGEVWQLTTDEAWDGHPCISSDGRVIVFTSDRDGNYEIYRINRDGTGLERLTENEAVDDNATIT